MLLAAARAAHPERAVGRQRDPRPERPPRRAARHRGHREPPGPPAAALARPRTYVTGTPIRSLADVDRDEARERFGGRPGERILLVFGGSQAVRRINDAVCGALPRLVERVRVIHVTGDAGYAGASPPARRCRRTLRDRYRPFPFLHDDMTAALAAADLAVGPRRGLHAGRGRRLRAADGDRPVPARRRAPAPATPRHSPRPAPPCWSRTRRSTPTAWSRSPACSRIPPATP